LFPSVGTPYAVDAIDWIVYLVVFSQRTNCITYLHIYINNDSTIDDSYCFGKTSQFNWTSMLAATDAPSGDLSSCSSIGVLLFSADYIALTSPPTAEPSDVFSYAQAFNSAFPVTRATGATMYNETILFTLRAGETDADPSEVVLLEVDFSGAQQNAITFWDVTYLLDGLATDIVANFQYLSWFQKSNGTAPTPNMVELLMYSWNLEKDLLATGNVTNVVQFAQWGPIGFGVNIDDPSSQLPSGMVAVGSETDATFVVYAVDLAASDTVIAFSNELNIEGFLPKFAGSAVCNCPYAVIMAGHASSGYVEVVLLEYMR